MADEALHPKYARRHHEVKALQKWLGERGIEAPLRGRIVEIDVWFGQYDDLDVRSHAVNQMERGFRVRRDNVARSGRHALAVLRLYQQLLHCD